LCSKVLEEEIIRKTLIVFSFLFVKEIAVVGNKVDLIDREEVKYDDAKNYAKVSRKMDNCDLLKNILQEFEDKNLVLFLNNFRN